MLEDAHKDSSRHTIYVKSLLEYSFMNYPVKLSYTIRPGDTLYQLARRFKTTVAVLISDNPDMDPYNLQVGSKITIYPGKTSSTGGGNCKPPFCPVPCTQTELMNDMRLVWSQHVYWSRMYLISLAEQLKDQNDVANRLLQNPGDIANIFARFYSDQTANMIERLLTEHLQIGAKLIVALRDGQTEEAEQLKYQWHENANQMAVAFNRINPYYKYEDLHDMLDKHLELTTQEVVMRLSGNYPADIEAFNKVEQEAMEMADYFTAGIMKQFLKQ